MRSLRTTKSELPVNERELFIAALQIEDATGRTAYLDKVCHDELLRARVEALLAAYRQAGHFLQQPAVDPAATTGQPSTEGPNSQIGPYKVLEQIGEGGMGVVYMAEQIAPIRRRVALKIIKMGMDTRQVIARFEAERQALALMDHSNIARVFDAGSTDSGRPYFVMELVRGVPITEYCDLNNLRVQQRLELFVQVCHAVQHAHQKGIIHRDIKPSNVLVTLNDGRAVPKIIDFGVAKATSQQLTEKTLFTAFAQMIGTPLYMSPEQAEMTSLDVDTRADIYSLGVLLYELLTGTTPFDQKRLRSAAYGEMIRIIREEEPPKPSTRISTLGEARTATAAHRQIDAHRLGQLVRGDLDWIVMKSLEKDRTRRYETANDLAADVVRHLDNKPVEACPPTAVYRLRKFVRRNRLKVAAATAVFITLVAGITGSTLGLLRALDAESTVTQQNGIVTSERDYAVRAQSEAQTQRQKAEAESRRALLRLADNYTSRGLEGSNSTWNARAALWFANAAVTARDDPQRAETNLLRVNNWLKGQWTPVAAVGRAGDGNDQLAFDSENSRYLITFRRRGSIDAPPWIWDLATEEPLRPAGEFDPPSDAAWASQGQVLLGSPGGHVALASVPDLKILRQWDAGGAVKHVAAGSDGRFVAATSGKKLLVWEVSGNGDPSIVEHPEEIVYVGFSPLGTQLVTATDREAKARLFSIGSGGSQPPQLRQVLGPVTHLFRGTGIAATNYFTKSPLFADEGRTLVTIQDTGSRQRPGLIKWYDTASGAELATTKSPHLSEPRAVAASPDGSMIAVGSAIFSARTRQEIQTFTNTISLAFGPTGLVANSDAGVEVYRIEPGKTKSHAFPIVNKGAQPAFSREGKYMAIIDDGIVQVFQIPSGSSPASLSHKVPLDGSSTWATFSRDGQYTAPIGNTAGSTTVRTIQVCATATGKPVGKPLALDANLIGADFSPDGLLIAAVTGRHGDSARLQIWNWQTGVLASAPFRLDSEPVSLCFAPDGKAVAVHDMNGLAILVDPATGNELLRVQCQATRMAKDSYPWMTGRGTIAFSRDGRTFFTWGSPVIEAWDRATGQERFAIKHRENCWAFAESPNGQTLATASYDHNLCLWHASNGNELYPPIEHPSQLLTVAFSPDGQLLATACGDGQTRVWDVATGKLAYAMSPGGWLTDVRFTPDGRFVINAGASGLQLWDSRTGYAIGKRIGTGTGAFPQLDITPDAHWGVISGSADFYFVTNLEGVTGAAKDSPGEALLWAELLSNSRINDSTIVNLSDSEWLQRWRQYRRQHPEFRPLNAGATQ